MHGKGEGWGARKNSNSNRNPDSVFSLLAIALATLTTLTTLTTMTVACVPLPAARGVYRGRRTAGRIGGRDEPVMRLNVQGCSGEARVGDRRACRRHSRTVTNIHINTPHRRLQPPAAATAAAATVSTTALVTSLKLAFVANPISFLTSFAALIAAVTLSILLIYLIPALIAFRRTMVASEMLIDSLQDELPDTLAAVRLSGLELQDAIEEVSDLGSDLTAGLRASARALVGAESNVREGAHLAKELWTEGRPLARRAAERALVRRSGMKYSEGTVASVAKGAATAAKRLRFGLAAANAASWGAAMVEGGRRQGGYADPYSYPADSSMDDDDAAGGGD